MAILPKRVPCIFQSTLLYQEWLLPSLINIIATIIAITNSNNTCYIDSNFSFITHTKPPYVVSWVVVVYEIFVFKLFYNNITISQISITTPTPLGTFFIKCTAIATLLISVTYIRYTTVVIVRVIYTCNTVICINF